MTQEFHKLLYSIHRDDYKDDIALISKGISNLESLAKLSIRLEPSRRKQSRDKFFAILRDLSTSVYRAFCSSILCTHPHDVSLELSPRFIEIGYDCDDKQVMRNAQFNMVISFEMVEGTTTKRFWDEVNIKTKASAATTKSPAYLSQPQVERSNRASVYVRPRLRIPFMSSSSSIHRAGSIPANMSRPVTDFVSIKVCPEDGKQKQPLDICMALRNARIVRPILYGRLVDEENADRQFQVFALGTTVNSDCWLRNICANK